MPLKVYLQYPCGKKFEIRVPIVITDKDGKQELIMPGTKEYFYYAKNKFQINNLKVIEQEVQCTKQDNIHFVSLAKKTHSIE